ncbi:MAG: hypothetical protein ACI4S9_09005, partial [Christensenellales bacterium]
VLDGERRGDDQIINFQAPDYMLQLNPKQAGLTGFNALKDDGSDFEALDFSQISELNTEFFCDVADSNAKVTHAELINGIGGGEISYWRMIEGGRFMQRIDVLKMVYDNLDGVYGRLEVAAGQESFGLTYQVFSESVLREVRLSFGFSSAKYSKLDYYAENVYTAKDAEGNGIAFILPDAGNVRAEIGDGKIVFTRNPLSIQAGIHAGFGIQCVPFVSDDVEKIDRVVNRSNVEIKVSRSLPTEADSVEYLYNETMATFKIDGNVISGYNYYDYSIESNRGLYDEFKIEFTNPTEYDLTVPFAVLKNTSEMRVCDREFGTAGYFGMSGMTPVLRDEQGIPTGIPVQISKNWHNGETELINQLYQGQWFAGYTEVTVPAGETVTYVYTIAYSTWGGLPATSHSQLSLVGWGMYDAWEQMALGSWGESVCFHPQDNKMGSWIQDIRGFMITNKHGFNQQYNWSGNSGGAEFLRYEKGNTTYGVNDMYLDYYSQGPNLTDIRYYGRTSDGKVDVAINIMQPRTDDIIRNYYKVTYNFLEDTDFSRLTLFQYSCDR